MAVVIRKPQTTAARVAAATARTHQQVGRLVVETSLDALAEVIGLHAVPAVAVVESDVVEIVVEEPPPWPVLREAVERLATEWTDIIVLVPSETMGEAHAGLRGAPAVLQQWWLEDETVRFGATELL